MLSAYEWESRRGTTDYAAQSKHTNFSSVFPLQHFSSEVKSTQITLARFPSVQQGEGDCQSVRGVWSLHSCLLPFQLICCYSPLRRFEG